MESLGFPIMLCGLFCFPATIVIREWRVRPVWALGLVFAIVGSVAWVLYDSQPSSSTRYSPLGYAAVLLVSTYLYFTSPKHVASTIEIGGSLLGAVRENARWFVIGIAVLFAATIYACENRYQLVPEKGNFQSPYVKVLDRWTGEVMKK
jgi:hypothetical protein